jgi:hypothetical protein
MGKATADIGLALASADRPAIKVKAVIATAIRVFMLASLGSIRLISEEMRVGAYQPLGMPA